MKTVNGWTARSNIAGHWRGALRRYLSPWGSAAMHRRAICIIAIRGTTGRQLMPSEIETAHNFQRDSSAAAARGRLYGPGTFAPLFLRRNSPGAKFQVFTFRNPDGTKARPLHNVSAGQHGEPA